MRIISCYIENYGKISKRKIDFATNATSFCEENGYGKTTIASFIKAMFYGLQSYRSNTKEFNDRQHFFPFNRGKFGGNITIECLQKVYKIERFFDIKSDKNDTLNVYDKNGSRTDELGDKIGEKIFGIDEDSFVRTAFLSSEEIDTDITSGINAKLNNLVDNTNDVNNFQSAISSLERASKSLRADRGQGGMINQTKSDISALKEEIDNLTTIEQGLREIYIKRNELNEQLKLLEEQSVSIRQAVIEQNKWQTYDTYLQDITDKESELKEIRTLYSSGLPSTKELLKIDEELDILTQKKAELGCSIFTEEKQQKLLLLSNRFKKGTPTNEQLSEIANKISNANKIEARISQEQVNIKNSTIEDLSDKFRKGIPEEKLISQSQQTVKLYAENEDKIKQLSTDFSIIPNNQSFSIKNRRILDIILSVLAAALIIAGGIFCAFIVPVGITLIVLGIVIGISVGFLYLKRKMTIVAPLQNAETVTEINKLRCKNAIHEKSIRTFLSPYGYFSDSVMADFVLFERDLTTYKNFLIDNAENTTIFNELKTELERLKSNIATFFLNFNTSDVKFSDCMVTLKTAMADFESLTKERRDITIKNELLKETIADTKKKINDVFAQYKISFDFEDTNKYKQIKDNQNKTDSLSEQILQLRKKADSYKDSNALLIRPVAQNLDIDANEEQCKTIRDEISAYNAQINDCEFRLTALPDAQSKLEEKKEKLLTEEEKYNLLKMANSYLKQAEQNLIDQYLSPMKSSFASYADKISKDLTDRMCIDEKLNISFERDGEQRSDKHLSSGQKCICQLCMRFALIDQMYKTEKPFIIMDDPFVSLDEKHLESVLDVLKKLTKDRQIIYFCCHNSRQLRT